MRKLHIFIETSIPRAKKSMGQFTNEYHFVEQYIRHVVPGISPSDYEIVDVGGKDKLAMYDYAMQQNTANGETNAVIFDCDEPSTGGGFPKRSKELLCLQDSLGVNFSLFLFPNNKDDGAFEDMLLKIVNPRHQGLLDCFKSYEMCIGGQDPDGETYETPNKKAAIYSYITSFKRSRSEREKIKSGNWDFQDPEYWQLDAPYLAPLKEFIQDLTEKLGDKQ